METITALRALGGAARVSELAGLRVSRAAVDRAVAKGAAVRAGRGLVSLPDAEGVVVDAARLGGLLTCTSALRCRGLPALGADEFPHVAIASGSASQRPDVRARLHRASKESLRAAGVKHGRVAPHDVVLAHASRCLSLDAFVCAVDASLNRGLASLHAVVSDQRIPHAVRSRLLRMCDPRAESPLESLARIELDGAGLSCWPQAPLPGIGRVDLLVGNAVVVELDGREYHERADAFRRDRDRDRRATELGYRVLRFTSAQVLRRDGSLARQVERVLGGAAGGGVVGRAAGGGAGGREAGRGAGGRAAGGGAALDTT